MARSRRKASGRSRWIAVALVAAAAVVNRQPLLKLFHANGPQPAPPDSMFQITSGAELPAVPAAEVAAAGPVGLAEAVADPMSYRSFATRQPDRVVDEQAAPPPIVTLILHGKTTRRALIEGVIIGVGDTTRVGKVVAIEPALVLVRSETGHTHALRLGDGQGAKKVEVEGREAAGKVADEDREAGATGSAAPQQNKGTSK